MEFGWFGGSIAGLACVGVVTFLVLRHRVRPADPSTAEARGSAASQWLAHLAFTPAMLISGFAVVVVGGIGAWDRLILQRVGWFDLDLESSIASALSALLLVGASAASVLVAARQSSRRLRGVWLAAAGGLVALAVDERRALHERLESSTGSDWQLLYLPVFLAGGAFGVVLFRELRSDRLARRLFLGAAGMWCFAQFLEVVQWDGDRQVDGYEEMMVIEEIAEMAGSLLLIVDLLDRARRPEPVG